MWSGNCKLCQHVCDRSGPVRVTGAADPTNVKVFSHSVGLLLLRALSVEQVLLRPSIVVLA